MATIQQSIAIADGVTPQFQKMAKAAEATTGKFERAAAAANQVENAVSCTTVVVQVQDLGSAAYSAAGRFEAATAAAGGFSNKLANMSGSGLVNIRNALDGLIGKFALGNIIANGITSIAERISRIPGELAHLSDEYSGIVARIKLITSSAEEAAAMNDQIYYSALRARGSYAGMADAVSKIGLTAKEAFPNPNQIIPFVENIQKLFTVGETGIQQQKDVMLQLTQALGSGKLQGDEFRSIAEAAPMIEQIVARYMGVTQGQLKELSSEGAITAEIMKNAILGATDEINAKFAEMPLTWGQIWQNMKTVAFKAFVPVFEKISSLANNQGIQKFVDNVAMGIAIAGVIITGVINNVEWLASVVTNTLGYAFSWVSAIAVIGFQAISAAIPFVMAGVLGLAAGWLVLNTQALASTAFILAFATASRVAFAAMIAYEAVMNTLAAAKRIWIAVTSGATIAQILLAAATWLGVSPILALAAVIVGVMVVALAIWKLSTINLRNAIATAFSSIAEIAGNVINFMIRRVNDLISVLNKAASAINNVFGTKIGTVDLIGEVDAKAWGKAAGDFVQNFDISKLGSMLGLPELPAVPSDSYGGIPPIAADIANAGKDTANNTKGIKEAMEITDEDIKYLRDIAEQEVINRYTTAEVKIEMGGIHNTVSSEMDLDGLVRYINDSLFEAMVSGAEKVHP